MPHPNAKTELKLDIETLSYGPYGIGRLDGKAVMIPHTAPGDQIIATISETKERYSIGAIDRLIRPSPLRQTPPCRYVGQCGGCSWQHLRYDAQLAAKQQSVADALRRIGKLDNFELKPIIGSADEYHYRRRIRMQAGGKRLGFFGAASHHLVEIDSCLIADERLNSAIEPLRRWLRDLNGAIEHVEIIAGDAPGELVIVAQSADPLRSSDEPVCAALLDAGINIIGMILLTPNGRRVWGTPWITVVVDQELSLKLDADVFSQVNPEGNRQILRQLLAAGNFANSDHVLELYSGAGNFTLAMARLAMDVVAVEGFRAAVANGQLNAQAQKIGNIHWLCSAVPQALAQLKRQRRKFTKIVLDPPRAGAKDIAADLAALGAEMICYISCNPTTLARDLAALAKQSFKVKFVQPIDFFPHTFHVESLAVMNR